MTYTSLALRTLAWHQGEVEVATMQILLEGADEPTRFGTFVLIPPLDACQLMGIPGTPQQYVLSKTQVRERVRPLKVPSEKREIQRSILSEHLPFVPPPGVLWAGANVSARRFLLPVAFMAFGETVDGNRPVTTLQVLVGAPLDMALSRIKIWAGAVD